VADQGHTRRGRQKPGGWALQSRPASMMALCLVRKASDIRTLETTPPSVEQGLLDGVFPIEVVRAIVLLALLILSLKDDVPFVRHRCLNRTRK
jgi:hypothetical protein